MIRKNSSSLISPSPSASARAHVGRVKRVRRRAGAPDACAGGGPEAPGRREASSGECSDQLPLPPGFGVGKHVRASAGRGASLSFSSRAPASSRVGPRSTVHGPGSRVRPGVGVPASLGPRGLWEKMGNRVGHGGARAYGPPFRVSSFHRLLRDRRREGEGYPEAASLRTFTTFTPASPFGSLSPFCPFQKIFMHAVPCVPPLRGTNAREQH